MSIVEGYDLEAMVGDPDDHRPTTRWATLADPGDVDGRVDDLVVIVEHIGVGDRIPLHVHRTSEVIVVHGRGRPGARHRGGCAGARDDDRRPYRRDHARRVTGIERWRSGRASFPRVTHAASSRSSTSMSAASHRP